MVGVARPKQPGKGCVAYCNNVRYLLRQRELRGLRADCVQRCQPVTISPLARCPIRCVSFSFLSFQFHLVFPTVDWWMIAGCAAQLYVFTRLPFHYFTAFIMQKFLWRNFPRAACVYARDDNERKFFLHQFSIWFFSFSCRCDRQKLCDFLSPSRLSRRFFSFDYYYRGDRPVLAQLSRQCLRRCILP